MKDARILLNLSHNIEKKLPVFHSTPWLNSVCGEEGWRRVFSLGKDGQVRGVFSFALRQNLGFQIISQPILTPTAGPLIFYPRDLSNRQVYLYENEVLFDLIDQLPKFSKMDLCFDKNFDNWLPFFWRGYQQTTYYTNVLHNLDDLPRIINGFSQTKRREIRRAKRLGYTHDINSVSYIEFYDFHSYCLAEKGQKISYPRSVLERLELDDPNNQIASIVSVKDYKGENAALLFLAFDKQCTYNLMSGFCPNHIKSGASSLAVLEAIKFAATKSKIFDFEGSMTESVARSFRQFGAVQTGYYRVSKMNSLILRLIQTLR